MPQVRLEARRAEILFFRFQDCLSDVLSHCLRARGRWLTALSGGRALPFRLLRCLSKPSTASHPACPLELQRGLVCGAPDRLMSTTSRARDGQASLHCCLMYLRARDSAAEGLSVAPDSTVSQPEKPAFFKAWKPGR